MKDRETEYVRERLRYMEMDLGDLEQELGTLYDLRFEQHLIEYENSHRIASSVYLQRIKQGEVVRPKPTSVKKKTFWSFLLAFW